MSQEESQASPERRPGRDHDRADGPRHVFRRRRCETCQRCVSPWQIYVVRSLVVIPILSAIALFGPQPVSIRPNAKNWAFLRGLLLALMCIAIYAAMPVPSLSVIAASLYLKPPI